MIPLKPVAFDLFAGAGGLSLGLAQAGFDVRSAFDADLDAVHTYERNVGKHIFQADARDVSGVQLLEHAEISGGVALVAGGPPCQGFSVQRRGTDADERNELVLEFIRLVVECRPAMFLMENVSAMGKRRGRDELQTVSQTAERQGYRISYSVLDAADYGVPQHRRRLFVVGELDDGKEYFTFPPPSHGDGNRITVRDAIGDLPSPSIPASRSIANHEPDNISDLNRTRISHVPEGGGRADIPPELRLRCHRVPVETAGHRGVYGRLAWDRPAGTITTKCNSFTRGRFAHPVEHRNISMREAARIQGFPDEFVFVGDRVAVAHQIGNAVPPPLAMRLGLAIIAALRARQERAGRRGKPRQLQLRAL